MLPTPDAVQVPPPAPGHLQVQERDAGKVSARVAPVAVTPPPFETVMEYTTDPPGTAVATPSLLVIARSGRATSLKQTVTSLRVGVTAPELVARYALYLR